MLKTLQVYELYLYDEFNNCSYKVNQSTDDFSFEDIDINRTTVQRMVLLEWAKKENLLALKQIVNAREQTHFEKEERKTAKQPEPVLQIEYRPYQPRYRNPALETAIEINQEIYDAVEQGGKPPKQLITKELVAQKMTEKKGAQPSANEITKIDSLARPDCFKNQFKLKNG